MRKTSYTPEFGPSEVGGPSCTVPGRKTPPTPRCIKLHTGPDLGGPRILCSEGIRGRICNRALPSELPADGWCHLAPFGEFRGVRIQGETEEPCIQVFDADAFARMEAGFRRLASDEAFRGLLLDYDHSSWAKGGSTEAGGHIMDFQVRGDGSKPEDGAWVRIEFTPTGAGKVRNKEYSFLSLSSDVVDLPPGPDGVKRIRPVFLTDAALTNYPRLPVKALNATSPDVSSGGQQAEEAGNQKETASMKEIALALGLAEDADETAILAKIASLTEAAAQLPAVQNSLRELRDAQLTKDAEAFADQHSARILNRALVVEQFKKDPEGTKSIFGALAEKFEAKAKALNGGRNPTDEGKEKKDEHTGVARTAAAFAKKETK